MGKSSYSPALQLFKRPFFCCHVQESLSTLGSVAKCPVHSLPCSFVEGLQEREKPVEELKNHDQMCSSEGANVANNSISTLKLRINKLNRHSATFSTQVLRWCLPAFIRRSKDKSIADILNRAVTTSQVVLPAVSEGSLACLSLRNELCYDWVGERFQARVRHLDEDLLPLVQSRTCNTHHQAFGDVISSSAYDARAQNAQPVLATSKDSGVSRKLVPTIPYEGLITAQNKPRHGLLRTIIFHDMMDNIAAFSHDLLLPGRRFRRRRRKLWQFATEDNECRITRELHQDREMPFLMLKYDLIDLSTRIPSASFASHLCISKLLTHFSGEQFHSENDEDLWLSVAEEELSSSSSTASTPYSVRNKSDEGQDEVCDRLAHILRLYQLSFVLGPPGSDTNGCEITHATPELLKMVSTKLGHFRRAARTESLLQRHKLEANERFFFPFSFGRFSGSVCCIPVYRDTGMQWFCVLIRHPPRNIGRTKDNAFAGPLMQDPEGGVIHEISLIALLDPG